MVLPAASLLASYDGDNPAWPEVARLVRQMIAGRSTVLIYWLKYLFPCRAVLIREMLAIIESSSAALSPSERSQLIESLAVLAEDDPDSPGHGPRAGGTRRHARPVAGRAATPAGDAGQLATPFRPLDTANSEQRSAMARTVGELAAEVRRWSGSIDRPWAYVAACPRDEFDALAANLKSAGYAPLTIRPFAARDQMLVAASFDRRSAE